MRGPHDRRTLTAKHSSLDELSLSYNGGKDCLVLLILYLAALHKRATSSKPEPPLGTDTAAAPRPLPQTLPSVYIISPHPFLEVDDFNSGLPIVRTINVPGPSTNSLLNDYNIWTIQTDSPPQGWNIAAVVNGKKHATSNLDNRGFPACS